VVDPVNTIEALVTEYRRDKLNICYGGNTIEIYMLYRWQPDAKKVAATPSG
jgi:hypothetical protein